MNVFLVETPLQLLNAIEAKHYFENTPACLVILDTSLYPRDSLDRIASTEAWDGIHWAAIAIPLARAVPAVHASYLGERVAEYHAYLQQFFSRRILGNLARSLGATQNLFVGNYLQGHQRHFANALSHQALYLLDDGTDTLRINQSRKQSTKPPALLGFARLKGWLHRTLHEWNDRETESLTFFTAYDLEIRPGDSMLKNDYRHFRSLSSTATRTSEVLFLGQPLVGDGYLNKLEYFEQLEKVKAHFKDEDLVYIPHKREAPALITELQSTTGIRVHRFDLPIEFELVAHGRVPKAIASFFSSALENCRLIFGDDMEIRAFYIDPRSLAPGCEFVEDIYGYLKSKSSLRFQVVII